MILIVVDSLERCHFFLRLVRPVRHEFAFAFVTSEPLACLKLRRAGFRTTYLRRNPWRRSAPGHEDAASAIEVLNGSLSPALARVDARAIVQGTRRILSRHRISLCVIWNGQQLLGRTAARVCTEYRVPLRFLEISNLAGKLFSDPAGVNACSSIATEPRIIDALPMPSEARHRRWLDGYEASKRCPLPQSATRYGRKAGSALNYLLKWLTGGVARLEPHSVRAVNALPVPSEAIALSVESLARRRYVFLPLQVAGDTQLRLNSDIDNLRAIEIAARMAIDADLELIVKLHPAEYDAAMVKRVLDSRRHLDFVLASSPTIDLIRHATRVVTINSTVGLEAMLYDKPVVTLGRCLYRAFDRARLLKYVHGFLIDGIDYFGADAIEPAAARRLFQEGER
ncbi:capsular biosynthesis protein [Burkholderia sp. A1]|uniref:capsular polysaccharide export protein, LipB/KpsS family n=1 Tax=Burkholderia sp. A1 TaxID=148446 RepID=UPI00046A1A8F|nr:capsular biosynthesis protein [Burkholderia sp. A1]